jgi:uncharacterized protein YabE (DUF348 family)
MCITFKGDVSLKIMMLSYFMRSRLFAIGIFLSITLTIVGVIAARATVVRVTDESGTKSIVTMNRNAKDILKQCGDTVGPYDKIDFSGFGKGYAEIQLKRAFNVHISVDGKSQTLMVTGGLVADALTKAGVSVGSNDEITLPPEMPLEKDMDIRIGRVVYKNVVNSVAIPYPTNKKTSYLLRSGVTKLASPGANGVKEVTKQQKIIDGMIVNSSVINEKVTKAPLGALMLVGAAKKSPISQIEPPDGFAFDSKGSVASYKKVVTGYATAYSAKSGARTASGKKAMVGHIAVNPKVIPYGSKLYIETTDGSCVYGYAIAADTGGFINRKDIPVVADLFFDSYAESCLWGVKKINIYILP